MHQNTFGGQAPPGPAGELKRCTYPLATIKGPTSNGTEKVALCRFADLPPPPKKKCDGRAALEKVQNVNVK